MDENAASDEKAGFERFRRLAESGEPRFVDRDQLRATIDKVFSGSDSSTSEKEADTFPSKSPLEPTPDS